MTIRYNCICQIQLIEFVLSKKSENKKENKVKFQLKIMFIVAAFDGSSWLTLDQDESDSLRRFHYPGNAELRIAF